MYKNIRLSYIFAVFIVGALLLCIYLSYRGGKCFCFDDETSASLSDVLALDVDVGKSIFFIDTTCNSYEEKSIVIKRRAACAVESAALNNPNRKVFFLYASPGTVRKDDELIGALTSYKNIRLSRIFVPTFLRHGPVESLYLSKTISSSHYSVSHYSDLLRFVVLFRFGGIYLDTDVLVLKSFEDIPSNSMGLESSTSIGSAVLYFDQNGVGHDFLGRILTYLNENYNPNDWGANGPQLITKFALAECNTTNLNEATDGKCANLNLFPNEYFYPIPWVSWEMFFNEGDLDAVLEKAKKSYTAHIWNKLSADEELQKDSDSAYMKLAEKNCPKVFGQLSEDDKF